MFDRKRLSLRPDLRPVSIVRSADRDAGFPSPLRGGARAGVRPCGPANREARRDPHPRPLPARGRGAAAQPRCLRKAFLSFTWSPSKRSRSQPAVLVPSAVTKSHSKVPRSPATVTRRFSNLPPGNRAKKAATRARSPPARRSSRRAARARRRRDRRRPRQNSSRRGPHRRRSRSRRTLGRGWGSWVPLALLLIEAEMHQPHYYISGWAGYAIEYIDKITRAS